MSDERQNRLILSADKIAWQKSVACHAKIARFCPLTKSLDFVCQDIACSTSTILSADFLYIGQQILFMLPWWLFTMEDEYLF